MYQIAACVGTGTKVAVTVDRIDNLHGIYRALETGPDAVILNDDEKVWSAAIQLKKATRISSPVRRSNPSSSD